MVFPAMGIGQIAGNIMLFQQIFSAEESFGRVGAESAKRRLAAGFDDTNTLDIRMSKADGKLVLRKLADGPAARDNATTAMKITFQNFLHAALGVCFFSAATSALAQQRPPPIATNDESGFVKIFDGQSLAGWEGDPQYWRVEDGALVGEVTPTNLLKVNSFIVWRGGGTRDFELKAEYRISAKGNSGINYRSVLATNFGAWAMRGYQADIDGANRYTGQNYEEKGRTFLALRGQVTRVEDGKIPQIIGTLGTTNELLSIIRTNDWNEYHLIVSGNVMTHILNGRVMSVTIDEDAANRKFDGQLGVQVHVGPPMKIEYRNVRLKRL